MARLGKSMSDGIQVGRKLPVQGTGRRASGWGLMKNDEGGEARCGGALDGGGQVICPRAQGACYSFPVVCHFKQCLYNLPGNENHLGELIKYGFPGSTPGDYTLVGMG